MVRSWTYEKAGVPHLKGDTVYNRKIAQLIRSTYHRGVLGSLTGFAALFDLEKSKLQDPLLVSSTDGVGTKLELAHLQGRHDTVGIDLVAMCVNDVITSGARPLFFLDYFASGKFDAKVTLEVLKGIAAGCRQAGCALVGGETAIMPGFYQVPLNNGTPQYDLAGFSVGVVERRRVITGSHIRKGHQLLGLASTGFHSNGFSLLRKIFSRKQLQGEIGRKLLVPTRIYVKPILNLLKQLSLDGIVNITGGGFIDNIPRVLPENLSVRINSRLWKRPKIFDLVQDSGNIPPLEMFRTFNMGVGMILILKPREILRVQNLLSQMRVPSWVIGEVVPISKGRSRSRVMID